MRPLAHAPAQHRPAAPRRRLRTLAAAATLSLAAGVLAPAAPAAAANVATPRDFTGYGFDQCLTPTQSAMDRWLRSSPFWAVGIYISGKSRACRSQPNQTSAWVKTQLAAGWRVLPITLGPQASCNPRFPRYNDDVRINASSSKNYRAARKQGRAEAADAVNVAQGLGIVEGSTLWYDMEAYDIGNTNCRESALHFTSAWTKKLHKLDYVSGVYSSAASGIKALDDARVDRPKAFALPDQIWIARWDGQANTSTGYIRDDGWRPGGRMKQYLGGHNETHGGVTINIDSNFLDLGKGSTAGAEPKHCNNVKLNFRKFPSVSAGSTGKRVSAAQCILTERGYDPGPVNGTFGDQTAAAVSKWRTDHGISADPVVGPRTWVSLNAAGSRKIIKYGAAGERVRRLQRALNSASGEQLKVNGVLKGKVTAAVKRYQSRVGIPSTGVVTTKTWKKLGRGVI